MRLACGMLQQVSISKLLPDMPLGSRASPSTPMAQSSQVEVEMARCCNGAVPQPPPEPVEPPPPLVEDVNGNGIVNILDLTLVGLRLGQTGDNEADVNGDGVVDIADLVQVAGAIGNVAAAPAVHPMALINLTAADIEGWLTQAQALDRTDVHSQRGILFLEQLLATLAPKETALLPNFPKPIQSGDVDPLSTRQRCRCDPYDL